MNDLIVLDEKTGEMRWSDRLTDIFNDIALRAACHAMHRKIDEIIKELAED